MSKELDPLSRIEEAWFAVFFVRYWRKWLTTCTHGQYTLTNNFITLNAHVCIELNAHALVNSLIILRDQMPHLNSSYLPWLLSSQTCERTFRAARSMSSTFSTMINFSTLGLLKRLHKLQIQIELQSESDVTGINYPYQEMHKKKDGNKELLTSLSNVTNEQIEKSVKIGLTRARDAMDKLGMKDSLIKNKQWEICFDDGSTINGDIDGEEIEADLASDVAVHVDEDEVGTGAISLHVHVDTCTDLHVDEEHNLVNTLEMLEKQKVIDIDEGAKKG